MSIARMENRSATHAHRGADHRSSRRTRERRTHRPFNPRTLGRQRLPRRPTRRANPPRSPRHRDLRCLRRHHLRPPLPPRKNSRTSNRRTPRLSRNSIRSRPSRAIHRARAPSTNPQHHTRACTRNISRSRSRRRRGYSSTPTLASGQDRPTSRVSQTPEESRTARRHLAWQRPLTDRPNESHRISCGVFSRR